MKYVAPEMELNLFAAMDVIAASQNQNEDYEPDKDEF